jgi:Kef-type K+ transport system membrane component KefB
MGTDFLPQFLPRFLPTWPLPFSEFLLLGMLLLLGLVGGRIASFTRVIPVIAGYILVGFACGPGGFNLIGESLLRDMRLFVDISLGLILFDLGRRIDWHWLRAEKWLLATGIAESALTFMLLLGLLILFDMPVLDAALVAAIGVATSAAVVMRVASDVSAEGPVTRRAFSLVVINNLFALLLFTVLVSTKQIDNSVSENAEFAEAILHPLYLLLGSVALGVVLFHATALLARVLKRVSADQFILQLAMIVAAVGLANMLNLSVLLTLLTLGLMVRNAQRHRRLPMVEFGELGQLFYVLLFVMTGASLTLNNVSGMLWLALLFIAVRTIAKAIPIFAFGLPSKVSARQSAALSLTMTPFAGLAAGMAFMLGDVPALAPEAAAVLIAAVTLMQFAGPIAARVAFTLAREAEPVSAVRELSRYESSSLGKETS